MEIDEPWRKYWLPACCAAGGHGPDAGGQNARFAGLASTGLNILTGAPLCIAAMPNARSLRDALVGPRRFDLGGLELGYGPDDRSGLDFADLAVIGSDGRFRR